MNFNYENNSLEIYKENLIVELRKSDEITILKNQIDFNNFESIMEFGKEALIAISNISGELLKYLKIGNSYDDKNILDKLTKIMDKMDEKDFEEEQSGFFEKFFKKKNSIEDLTKKYGTISNDIESFYRSLKGYEKEMLDFDKKLGIMLNSNMNYLESLEKHLIAIEEVSLALNQYNDNGPFSNKELILDLISKKIEDFRISEILSMESVMIIREIKRSNGYLIEKLQGSFFITLPILKQSLAQIIILKRKELQYKALEAVKKTSERELLAKKTLENLNNDKKNNLNKVKEIISEVTVAIEESNKVKDDKKNATENYEKKIENIEKKH
ncbi:MAG: toxic anion resistance protein [Sarcina sp.]